MIQRKKNQKASTSNNGNGRSKRACTEIDINRFGATENSIDHNSFFNNLPIVGEDDIEIASPARTNTNAAATFEIYEAAHTTDTNLADLIKQLMAKVDVLQESIIKMEVKIEEIYDQNHISTGVADVDELKKFGLPIESLAEMDFIEKSLSNDDTKIQLVGFLFGFLYKFYAICVNLI